MPKFSLIIDNKLNKEIIYKAPFRANERLVDKELLQLAKEAGFWLIFYGVESGNQEMLNRMKKKITVREFKRAFELTHSVGLKTIGSFMIGLPGEDKKTIKDTFNLRKELNPYIAGYAPAVPFPGTEFEKNVIDKGHLLTNNYDEYFPELFVVRTDSLTKEKLEYYRKFFEKRSPVHEKRELKRKIASLNRLKEIIIDSLRNPASIFRRMKNLYNLLILMVKKTR